MSMPQSLQSLQSEGEYRTALKNVRSYFENEPVPASLEAAHFDALVALIEDYEARHYSMQVACPPGCC